MNLVEPLGAKDVVHLDVGDGHGFRVVCKPGHRPTIGENVGLAFGDEHRLLFDDASGEAVTV